MAAKRRPKLRVVGMVAIAGGLLLGTATSADSQPVPPTAPSVGDVVSVGQTVWVTTTDGGTRKGVVFSVSASVLELLTDQRKLVVSFGDVSKVEVAVRDSLTNGIRNGLLAGGLSGVALGIFVVASDCAHPSSFLNFCSRSAFVDLAGMVGLWGAGIGAIAGWLVDASTYERRVVYRAGRSVSVGVAPQIAARGAGVRVVARW